MKKTNLLWIIGLLLVVSTINVHAELINGFVSGLQFENNFNNVNGINNGTGTSTFAFSPDAKMGSYALLCNGGYVSVNDSGDVFDFVNKNFTISYWEKSLNSGGSAITFARTNVPWNAVPSYMLYEPSTGGVGTLYGGKTAGNWDIFGGVSFTSILPAYNSTWILRTITRNNMNVSSYENGVFKYSTTMGAEFVDNTGNLMLCTGQGSTQIGKFYMDDFFVWNRALSTTEITSLYNSGNGTAYPFGARASGGVITTVGNYTVHTFTGNSNFAAYDNINAEILVVAGGGSGGTRLAGGGGAGGLIYNNSYTINAGNYSVIVGLGGASQPASAGTRGANGTDSVFNNLRAIGGGGGGSGNGAICSGLNGGSGGGACGSGGGSFGGNGTLNQGLSGGNTSSLGGAGGGGFGSVGGSSTTNSGGNGGTGYNLTINGSSVIYSCGGGGSAYTSGTPGIGGCSNGGNGSLINARANDGINGTGSGGGASGQDSSSPYNGGISGAGGSGIVIIKYLTTGVPPITFSIKGTTKYNTLALANVNLLLINPSSYVVVANTTSNATGGYKFDGSIFAQITNNSLWLVTSFFNSTYTKSIYVNVTVPD